jgi:hypothetical protein
MSPDATEGLRRYRRVSIAGLSGTLRSPGDVEVLNLGLAGLAFEVPATLAPGDHCFLELHHGESSAAVEVEIRWAAVRRVERRADTLKPVFRAGGAFIDIHRDGEGGFFDWLVVDPSPAAVAG